MAAKTNNVHRLPVRPKLEPGLQITCKTIVVDQDGRAWLLNPKKGTATLLDLKDTPKDDHVDG